VDDCFSGQRSRLENGVDGGCWRGLNQSQQFGVTRKETIMPNINFICPQCSQSISAPDDFIGADTQCPTRKQTFRLNMA
jgi:hypothetical protein